MAIIQIVLDSKLLEAADRAARRAKVNRSALMRNALRDYLKTLRTREMEERDRVGHLATRDAGATAAVWEAEAAWPED